MSAQEIDAIALRNSERLRGITTQQAFLILGRLNAVAKFRFDDRAAYDKFVLEMESAINAVLTSPETPWRKCRVCRSEWGTGVMRCPVCDATGSEWIGNPTLPSVNDHREDI